MASSEIKVLLAERREQWHRFHQLRGIAPTAAAEARIAAIAAEQRLSSQGFHGLMS